MINVVVQRCLLPPDDHLGEHVRGDHLLDGLLGRGVTPSFFRIIALHNLHITNLLHLVHFEITLI